MYRTYNINISKTKLDIYYNFILLFTKYQNR